MARGSENNLPDLMAEINARISEFAAASDTSADSWEFRCECGAPVCRGTVAMSLTEYGALRQSEHPVMAPGHARSSFA